MLNLLMAVMLGAAVGAVARWLVRTPGRGGCATNIAVGILGAVIGSLVARFLGGVGVTGPNLHSFLVALAGAVVFLLGARALSKG